MAAVAAERVGPVGLAAQASLTPPASRIRAFFAIALPGPQRDELSRYLEACAATAPEFRWAVHDNLHLTLRFVGSVERDVVERIAGSVATDAGPAFEVALGDVGTFKRARLVRVVWLGVREGAEPMRRLAELLERECRAAGLDPEARAFKPHLTLARARPRDGAPLPELSPPPKLEPWTAREVVLFSSHLGRGGAVHEPIRAIRLRD
jgi:2'-5' RNA ligase